MKTERNKYFLMALPEQRVQARSKGSERIQKNGATMIFYSGDFPTELESGRYCRYIWTEKGFEYRAADGSVNSWTNDFWIKEYMAESFLVFLGMCKDNCNPITVLVKADDNKAYEAADLLIDWMGGAIERQYWDDQLVNWRKSAKIKKGDKYVKIEQ